MGGSQFRILTSILQGICEGCDIFITLGWLLSKGLEHYALHGGWESGNFLAQRRRWDDHMLAGNLGQGAIEGMFPTQPFVGHDSESILIAGETGFALQLLWGHVKNCSPNLPSNLRTRALSYHGKAKITQ